jgi:phage shock protein A
MPWLENFTFVMRSSITALREKVEDPERMLHQLICDMEEELAAVRASVAETIADEIQLSRQVEQTRKEADQWAGRAVTAMQRSDESAARSAIEQKLKLEERVCVLQDSYEAQQAQTAKLQAAYRDLEDKIRQARHKRTILVARLTRAQSANRINDALDRAAGTSAFAEFSRLERKVERAEAVNDAYDRLEGRDPDADALAAKFAADERRERLDAEFAAIKERVAAHEAPNTILDYMKKVWDACD